MALADWGLQVFDLEHHIVISLFQYLFEGLLIRGLSALRLFPAELPVMAEPLHFLSEARVKCRKALVQFLLPWLH